jgi:pimeloyl-ACP methyl ester carboxylesterase
MPARSNHSLEDIASPSGARLFGARDRATDETCSMRRPATPALLQRPGGRQLAYQWFGPPDGIPVLYCHGFPGSRLEAVLMAEAATEADVRLITADRPGFGRSTFQPARQIRDWTDDIAALADALALAHFAILGVSGGGPYAISAACGLPERVTCLGLVGALDSLAGAGATAGMNTAQAGIIELNRRAPAIAAGIHTWITAPFMRHFPASALYLLSATAPAADREVLGVPGVRDALLSSVREAFRQGGRGPAWELRLLTEPPAIDPAKVRTRTLLWHGEADATVPVSIGRRLAARIPDCRPHFLPGEGHFSPLVRRPLEILKALVTP